MRVVYALFDTLNRRSLECYGGTSVKTPNFNRLAGRTVTSRNTDRAEQLRRALSFQSRCPSDTDPKRCPNSKHTKAGPSGC